MPRHLLTAALLLLSAAVWAGEPPLRDPTAPFAGAGGAGAAAGEPGSGPLRLQAVIKGKRGKAAVISGRTCRPGEKCFGLRVAAIGGSHVVLKKDGSPETVRLSLFGTEDKK